MDHDKSIQTHPLHVTSGGDLHTLRPDRIVEVRPFSMHREIPAKAELVVYIDDPKAPDQLRLVHIVTDQTFEAVSQRVSGFLSRPRPGALTLRGFSALYAKKRGDVPRQSSAAGA